MGEIEGEWEVEFRPEVICIGRAPLASEHYEQPICFRGGISTGASLRVGHPWSGEGQPRLQGWTTPTPGGGPHPRLVSRGLGKCGWCSQAHSKGTVLGFRPAEPRRRGFGTDAGWCVAGLVTALCAGNSFRSTGTRGVTTG